MGEKIIKQLLASGNLKKIATALQAREFDRHTIEQIGIPGKLLMENAGKAIADAVTDAISTVHHDLKGRVLIFAGPGNNGADAVVAARHLLARDVNFTIYFVSDEKQWSKDLSVQFALLVRAIEHMEPKKPERFIKRPSDLAELSACKIAQTTIIVDGIFGAGLSRAPSGQALVAIDFINNYRQKNDLHCVVFSIDIPSGLSLEATALPGQGVRADHTITFGHLKRAHISEPTKSYCGKSRSVDIGLFENSRLNNYWIFKRRTLTNLFLPVPKTCHKGRFGHVMIFEGHPRFLGASRLSARAALRAGAGLVTIACEEERPLAMDLPEFMRCQRNQVFDSLLSNIDALVIGPGLSKEKAWLERALLFINGLKDHVPLIVIDADGLLLLMEPSLTLPGKILIATPHAKEAATLLGCDTLQVECDRFRAIEELSKLASGQKNEIIWVLKGATTLVRPPSGEIFAFHGELPVLSAGGSGDVLSGAIAGLYKQTPSPLAATLLAVSLQIDSANMLSKTIFKGSLASELADAFPLLTKR